MVNTGKQLRNDESLQEAFVEHMTDIVLKIIDERKTAIHNLGEQCDIYRKQLQENDE